MVGRVQGGGEEKKVCGARGIKKPNPKNTESMPRRKKMGRTWGREEAVPNLPPVVGAGGGSKHCLLGWGLGGGGVGVGS